MEGVELAGQIVAPPPSNPPTSKCQLGFHPSIAANTVGILDSASGTIGPTRSTSSTTTGTADARGVFRVIAPAMMPAPEESDSQVVSVFRTPRGLQLRSGELLDANIESIDETGIRFTSTATSRTFLPHQEIQSAQLKIPMRGVPIDVKKMERLLTVPRMRRDNPPTHLIVTPSGDYLRGRVIRMHGDSLEFDEGLTRVTLPRSAVAVIIWLHDRVWEDGKDAQPEGQGDNRFQVHVRMRSTGRYTFEPQAIEDEAIIGSSSLLGEIHCPLANIDTLDFGKNVIQQIAEREENAWRLQLAKLPKVFDESNSDGMPSIEQLGTGSDLVGKTAPNFELKTVDGRPWRLGNQNGKIVVLDFWASWCGPCMQAMPVVERAVRELDREDVIWVGINLEESGEKVQYTVDRLNVQSLVLLDSDGGVGAEYDARAIPLTVIIDAEGIVRHVFVGGGDETTAAIEKAVRTLAGKPTGPSQ